MRAGDIGGSVLSEHNGVVGSDYSCLALRGEDAEMSSWLPSDNTLVAVADEMDASGDLLIATADQWGPFAVTTQFSAEEPAEVGPEWEDVVEFSVKTGSSLAVTELIDNDPWLELVPGPGDYRVRVNARGRDLPSEADDIDDGDSDDEEPKEWYLVQAWPAEWAAPAVVRMASAYAGFVLNPPPALVIPEGEAGSV